MKIKISNWLFKLLFPEQWEHMGHLVDDVIRLEAEQKGLQIQIAGLRYCVKVSSDTNTSTYRADER